MKTQFLRFGLFVFVAIVPQVVFGQSIMQLTTNVLPYTNDRTFAGNTGYFRNADGLNKTDGTASGTTLLLKNSAGNSNINFIKDASGQLPVIGNILYFTTTDGLYKTDGTVKGTLLVKALGIYANPFVDGCIFKGTLYFVGSGSLWKSDGTEQGTVVVKTGTNITQLFTFGDFLFFTDYGPHGNYGELFSSDGTVSGTRLVKDASTISVTEHTAFTKIGNRFVFLNNNSTQNITQLWSTDGTSDGTINLLPTLISTRSGDGHVEAVGLSVKDVNYYFTIRAVDVKNNYTYTLWRTDGTVQGTSQVLGPYASGIFYYFTEDGLFAQIDSKRIIKIVNGQSTDYFNQNGYSAYWGGYSNGTVYFTAQSNGNEIWRSDGTSVGTYSLSTVDDKAKNTAIGGNGSVFTINNATFIVEGISNSSNSMSQISRIDKVSGKENRTIILKNLLSGFVPLFTLNGKELGLGSSFVLSSFNPGAAPVQSCSLTASISGNITLPCTTNATTPLTASTTGGTAPLTYQWQRNNTNISGATSATYAANTIGDYTVLITDSKSCSAVSTKLTISSAKPITASITGSGTVCTGQPITINASLTNGTAPYTYQWKLNGNTVGTNTASLSITTGGVYSLSVTDACSSTTASFSVTESPSPAVSIGGTLAVCSGLSTTLTATATGGTGAYTYQWRQGTAVVGTNAPSLTAIGGNSYILTVTDAKGCAVTSTVSVTSGACATPTVSLPSGGATATAPITLTGSTGLTGGTDAGAIYQWLLNGSPIAGANNATYTASTSGSYAVSITLNGRTTTSPAIALTINLILAVEPIGLTENQVVIFPNPTTGDCQVTIAVPARQTIGLHIIDGSGKSIRQWTVTATPRMLPVRVTLPDADGMYFLRVETEQGAVTKKIVRIR